MSFKTIFPILFFLASSVFGIDFQKDSVVVIVSVEGFENDEGVCRLLLFENEKGFPDSREDAKLFFGGSIKNKKAEFSFKLFPGNYAISVLHDENMNGEMDKNWLGIPKEGFGASNNLKIGFGPPGFREAIVILDEKNTRIKIKMNYM